MEALVHPASLFSGSGANCWLIPEGKNTMWTKEENKKFERALAIFDEKTPDRWNKVAEMIPGKSVWDVIKQYKELEEDVSVIEAGLVPIPGYLSPSSFTLEWVDNRSFDALRRKSSSMAARPPEQERRKGVPWTEEEHRRFLLGLQKHGKGDWRNISRNFVISKTPTQVASHAQKYFLRQLSVGKDKKRPSIHDITTANLMGALPLDSKKPHQDLPLDQCNTSPVLPTQHTSLIIPRILLDWGHNPNDDASMAFDGVKLHGQNLYSYGHHGTSYIA